MTEIPRSYLFETESLGSWELRGKLAKLNPGLPDPTSLRSALTEGCWGEIYQALKGLPIFQQERLTEQVTRLLKFPNPNSFASELAKIVNIDGDFTKPKPLPDPEFLQERANFVLVNLGLDGGRLVRIISKLPEAATTYVAEVGVGIAHDHIERLIRQQAAEASIPNFRWAGFAGFGAVRDWQLRGINSAFDPTKIAPLDLEFTLFADKMPMENPFAAIMDIYQAGACPIGPSHKEFLIYCEGEN